MAAIDGHCGHLVNVRPGGGCYVATMFRTVVVILVGALVGATSSACSNLHTIHGDPALAAEAVLLPEEARAKALTVAPGDVKFWRLERGAQGSGLQYVFGTKTKFRPFRTTIIDAHTGAVLALAPPIAASNK